MTDDDLAPDMRRFHQSLAAGHAEHPPLAGVSLAEARRTVEAVRAPLAIGGPLMAHTTPIRLAAAPPHGLPLTLRVHRPVETTAAPARVYLHGTQYLRDDADRDDPLAVPLRADLHGLLPACLVVADCDVLRDDSLALTERLRAAGVPVEMKRHPGAPHSCLEAVSFAPTAQRALDRSGAWLRGGGPMTTRRFAALLLALLLTAPARAQPPAPASAPSSMADRGDLWLEDTKNPATQAWIAARNAETTARLQTGPRFERERRRFLSLGGGSHRETYLNGGVVHRVVADAAHPLGRWQALAADPAARRWLGAGWQTLLDLDELARRKGVRWTIPLWWQNPMCDTTVGPRCLLALSPDGGDRTVLREFDLATRNFVAGGFRIDTKARTYANWIDADHVLVASDFGAGSLSDAGYARQARLWRRGTPLAEARLLFEAPADAVLYIPHNFRSSRGTLFVAEVWHRNAGAASWWLIRTDRPAERFVPPVELVRYRGLAGIVDDRLIAVTAQPLARGTTTWPAGSLLALPLPDGRPTDPAAIEPVFVPRPDEAVDPVFHLAVAKDALWFGVMHDVSGRLYRTRRTAHGWVRSPQPVPANGAVRLLTGEVAPSAALVKTESLLTPPQTTLCEGTRTRTVAQAAPAFDAAPYLTEQRFATSRDGTRIPYYLTRARQPRPDASAAALLTAYGGFGVSSLPTYLNGEFHSDLLWPVLEAGGVFVHANVRGGGEYGPAWHRAAQGREHARGIEDLIAVAEDLVRAGLADPKRLGFIGASNGGLLAAATAVRRPGLFRAVVADVPLTDMLRFHELFTGAVWIDEYGDPRQPDDRAALAAYSPLQQLRAGVSYPEMLVTTSSSDDRVHPGHARRFAERLRELGQPVLFFESTDTGHGAAAALDAAARQRALKTTYLLQALGLR